MSALIYLLEHLYPTFPHDSRFLFMGLIVGTILVTLCLLACSPEIKHYEVNQINSIKISLQRCNNKAIYTLSSILYLHEES